MTKLLIVDDEPRILTLLGSLLKTNGIESVSARDGSQALKILAERSFDCIVSDIRMAPMDGMELFRAVRVSHPDVPLERLVRELDLPRDASRAPVYQAMFSYQDIRGRSPEWGGLRYAHVMLPHHTANQDIALWCFEDGDGLEADLNYNADIMSAESGAQLRRCFMALLEAVRQDPSVSIGDANLLGSEDRDALAGLFGRQHPVPRRLISARGPRGHKPIHRGTDKR